MKYEREISTNNDTYGGNVWAYPDIVSETYPQAGSAVAKRISSSWPQLITVSKSALFLSLKNKVFVHLHATEKQIP